MSCTIKEIIKKFSIETDILPYGNGHINDTYLCDVKPGYILQKINTNVFKNPEEVMSNIIRVTRFLRKKIIENGGNPQRETMNVIKTRDGDDFYKMDDNTYFRMYDYIENTVSHETVENPTQFYEAGKAFGKFQRMLNDFPADELFETIVDFHNTPVRVEQLKKAIEKNYNNRLSEVSREIEIAKKYSKYASIVVDAIREGEVPLRVTHNDTKLNNVLFDKDTDDAVCVIDLDTVMQGSLLYDFGDALRFGASSGSEDEKDLSKIWFDLEKFEAYTKGFLSETGDCMTKKEIELLAESALLLTYECGIRFLADYLNGDTYFKTAYETHNLDRARTQLKLVEDIESKLGEMKKIIAKYI